MQGNVFQCNLDNQFREFKCQQSTLNLKYINTSVTSPDLGKICLVLRILMKLIIGFFTLDDLVVIFQPANTLGKSI